MQVEHVSGHILRVLIIDDGASGKLLKELFERDNESNRVWTWLVDDPVSDGDPDDAIASATMRLRAYAEEPALFLYVQDVRYRGVGNGLAGLLKIYSTLRRTHTRIQGVASSVPWAHIFATSVNLGAAVPPNEVAATVAALKQVGIPFNENNMADPENHAFRAADVDGFQIVERSVELATAWLAQVQHGQVNPCPCIS